jgi:hypothetical protein
MPYESPRNKEELELRELQAERTKLQAAIKKGVCLDTYVNVAHQVTRLREVNHRINTLYIKVKGL